MWLEELECLEDVYHVFECYITGKKNKYNIKVLVKLFHLLVHLSIHSILRAS